MSEEKIQLKKINALNDYVAVMKVIEVPEGVEIDSEALKDMSNEGIVVGIGPDVVDSKGNNVVELGDRVIVGTKRYLAITPASGGYENQTVIMARKLDLVAKIGHADKYEIV